MQNSDVKSDKITVGVAAHSDPLKPKGITLIALIITIIVMLILVGVTISIALNGGLFNKAEEATTKTKIAQVKEALAIKKAEIVADNNGVEPEYTLTISRLSLPAELISEYGNKLKISKDGILYYDASIVTNEAEQKQLESMGIQEYVETVSGDSYTFTLADLVNRGLLGTNGIVQTTADEFFPDYVSDELKNSTITRHYNGVGDAETYNIMCSNQNYSNIFDLEDTSEPSNAYQILILEGMIVFCVCDENSKVITSENYTNYSDLTFTISMPE